MRLLMISLFGLILLLSTSCSEKPTSDEKVYSFLEVCYEDYYLNYNVQISNHLEKFEDHLLLEGHLKDTTGQAYLDLLDYLSSNIYFKAPLKYDDFNNTILYKVPDDITECANSIFGLDSTLVKNTAYFKAQERIKNELEKKEEISINDVFRYNSKFLSAKTIKSPFVKQSVLQLLYKWYFKSKHDREIPITKDHFEESHDSTLIKADS